MKAFITITTTSEIKFNSVYCDRSCEHYKCGVGMGNEWERCLLFNSNIYSNRDGTLRCVDCLQAVIKIKNIQY